MKKNQFLTGALILAVSGIICRVLGVVLRIPLTNIVGNFGMGLYQMVFPLYSLLLIISSAGVPVAISKMVAREKVGGDMAQCKKILWNAVILLGLIGFVLSVLFVIFSYSIAGLQGNRDVGIIYIAIAPSVFLVCIICAFRGYFQGLQNMIPTGVSQIIEQLVKIAVGLILALLLIKQSVVMAVFGAILAVTVSEAVALCFLVITYVFKSRKKHAGGGKAWRKLDRKVMSEIIKQSLPITAMATIFPFILVFDSLVIINLLKRGGASGEVATQLYGIQSGAVHTLINLPAVIGMAMATAVVPTVSSLIKQQKNDELRTKCALAVKLILIISVFFVAFYMFFADKIIDLLYHNAFKDSPQQFKIAVNLLMIESALVVLMGLSQVFTAMLQASDRSRFPLIALAAGGVVKIIFELCFISTDMGIYAVSISNVLCFVVAASINTFFALRTVKISAKIATVFWKVTAMCSGYILFLFAIKSIIPHGRWWLVLVGAVAFAFYAVFVLLLNLFDKNEKKVFYKLGAE